MSQLSGGHRVLGDLLCVRITELKAKGLDKPPPPFTCVERYTFATGVLSLSIQDSDIEPLYIVWKCQNKMPKDRGIIVILNMF